MEEHVAQNLTYEYNTLVNGFGINPAIITLYRPIHHGDLPRQDFRIHTLKFEDGEVYGVNKHMELALNISELIQIKNYINNNVSDDEQSELPSWEEVANHFYLM